MLQIIHHDEGKPTASSFGCSLLWGCSSNRGIGGPVLGEGFQTVKPRHGQLLERLVER